MRHLYACCVIAACSFLGELLHAVIPLAIPASIYGLILMFLGLATHCISLEKVKPTGNFLLEILPLLFVPAVVGVMDVYDALYDMLLPVVIILIVSTFVVIGVTALVTQALMHRKGHKKEEQQT